MQAWQESFGNPKQPMEPWNYVELDGCQHNLTCPGWSSRHGERDDPKEMGRPILKGQIWVSNFDLRPMGLQCACAGGGLLQTKHEHKPIRGSVKLAGGSWASLA
eukprot:461086-Lingulodinium_polyedra.AAC.1